MNHDTYSNIPKPSDIVPLPGVILPVEHKDNNEEEEGLDIDDLLMLYFSLPSEP